MTTAEELADLGIGNSKSKKPAFDTLDEELEAEEGGGPPPVRQDPATNGADAGAPSSKGDDKPSAFLFVFGVRIFRLWLTNDLELSSYVSF
jgi:hypothetical protein